MHINEADVLQIKQLFLNADMICLKCSVFLVILNYFFYSAVAKIYEECELARELHVQHNVPVYEVPQHLCVVNHLKDTSASGDYLGLYKIGSQWWCSKSGIGGLCNIECSKLTNDDISLDVQCASMILNAQGLGAWNQNQESCRKYYAKTTKCLKVQIIKDILNNAETLHSHW